MNAALLWYLLESEESDSSDDDFNYINDDDASENDGDNELDEKIPDTKSVPDTIRNKPNNFHVWNDAQFFERFRLKKNTVLGLFHRVEDQLLILWNTSKSLTPLNQLLLTLRFYATGNFLRACSDFSGVTNTTATEIVEKVSIVIASLSKTSIVMPRSNDEIRTSQKAFYGMYKFPRVIGCIGGTHIRIQSPGGKHAEDFRNRRGFFSLNTQVVCDSDMKIINIVARWPGAVHDGKIFQQSILHQRLEAGEFRSGLLLGDSGYPVRKYLLTPLSHPTTVAEQRYNDAHVRTRSILERLFGVWERRFPILRSGMSVKIETVQAIVVAVAVLHNIARTANEEDPPVYVDLVDEEIGNDNVNELNVVGDNRISHAFINHHFSKNTN